MSAIPVWRGFLCTTSGEPKAVLARGASGRLGTLLSQQLSAICLPSSQGHLVPTSALENVLDLLFSHSCTRSAGWYTLLSQSRKRTDLNMSFTHCSCHPLFLFPESNGSMRSLESTLQIAGLFQDVSPQKLKKSSSTLPSSPISQHKVTEVLMAKVGISGFTG